MYRRAFVHTAALATTGAVLGTSGCLGDNEEQSDVEPINEFGYQTTTMNGVEVPLVPADDAVEWHQSGDAIFVDTRDSTGFEARRIEGAILSPAPDGQDESDPVTAHSTDTKIVTYCDCPHHLAAMRGEMLLREGYRDTYAIDEGLFGWEDAGYPMEGENAQLTPDLMRITGKTAAAHAEELVWIRHDPTGQREVAPIGQDGGFTLNVRFHDVDLDSMLRVTAPSGELIDSLETLVSSTITV